MISKGLDEAPLFILLHCQVFNPTTGTILMKRKSNSYVGSIAALEAFGTCLLPSGWGVGWSLAMIGSIVSILRQWLRTLLLHWNQSPFILWGPFSLILVLLCSLVKPFLLDYN